MFLIYNIPHILQTYLRPTHAKNAGWVIFYTLLSTPIHFDHILIYSLNFLLLLAILEKSFYSFG